MKNKKLFVVINIFIMLIMLTSCHRVTGNEIHFEMVSASIQDNKLEIQTYWGLMSIDKDSKKYSISSGNNLNSSACEYVVFGGTAPCYGIDIKEGYENIEDDILGLNTLGKRSVIRTEGYLVDDYVYGICNVYSDTVGYLSGGGNYAEEEIAYSIYYKYDYINDVMETICKLDKSTMVAYNDDYVVYWKNKKFYSYNIETQETKELCDHLSYDSGLQHQSGTYVYFNNNYVIFEMRKAKSFNDYYYYYLYEYGKDIIKLTELSD